VSGRRGALHRAFAHPAGAFGAIGGVVMAVENRGTNRLVVDRLDLQRDDRVLEIGCGPGVAARAASLRVGPPVAAIDSSPTMIRLARTLSRIPRVDVNWRVASAEALGLADHSIDLVFAVNSWHHWDDHDLASTEIARVLAPDGRVAIVERTDVSHHPGAHGLDHEGIEHIGELLAARIGAVAVDHLDAGRDHLALIIATRKETTP
jgi:ubiquinone/menaquinone biosynthesis C-methylase UbiE